LPIYPVPNLDQNGKRRIADWVRYETSPFVLNGPKRAKQGYDKPLAARGFQREDRGWVARGLRMSWILLVTWIVEGIPGQGEPPATSSYQTQFHSQEACEVARDEVLRSAQVMRQQMWEDAGNRSDLKDAAMLRFPRVSAVCAAQ
jgi:hypothetical protein